MTGTNHKGAANRLRPCFFQHQLHPIQKQLGDNRESSVPSLLMGSNLRSLNGALGASPNARGACAFPVPKKSLHRKAERTGVLQLAFPNHQNFPALLRKGINVPCITCFVLPELRKPKVPI
jgi:hypothetical protein